MIEAGMVSMYWERSKINEALEKGQEKYREIYEKSKNEAEIYSSLMDSSADSIVISDTEDRVRHLNPSFTKIFGWTLDDVEGKEIPYIPKSEKSSLKALIKDIIENGVSCQGLETRLLTKEGRLLDVCLNASRYVNHKKKPAGVLYIIRDISERKKLEAQLVQAQKMEAIGTLAGGIAHDFNNHLQVVFGCAEILLMGKDSSHPDYAKLKTIEKSVQRASNLSKRLLVFGRKMENKFEPVDLNHEINQVSKILSRTIPKMINIDLDLAKGIGVINADPGQLEQIMINLGVNARDAMPNGGNLTFKTLNAVMDEEYCRTHPGSIPGKYVLLKISDNGFGMEQETLEHIFKPFFTTKKKGEGTGLGLAMVYSIVKNHKGYITCSSQPGRGTTFNIYFSVIEYGIPKVHNKESEAFVEGGNETILLVDDEESNRKIAKEILAGYGYNVIIAPDGERAFECYRRNLKKIDLVILDLIMPGKGGRALLEDLLRIDPHAKVIIASGYSAKGSFQEVMKSGAKDFITKPYGIKMMLKTVRKVLD